MIITLSPAKTLDYKSTLPPLEVTRPRFPKEIARLALGAAQLSAAQLGELMHISDKLAALNAERYHGFDDQPERPALFAFNGDVYTGFEAKSLPEEAIDFAQDHVRILSGLYGLLRPLDAMKPYRLEMGTRWGPDNHPNLYDFWGEKIATQLGKDAAEDGSNEILNLASNEYWQAVAPHPPKSARIVSIDFKEQGPKGLRFNSFGAKKARGMMARYVCEHRLDNLEAVKQFDSDGYAFDPTGSDAHVWRFVKG
ncbi:peroxide stress protein YaaA [Aquisediminimonas sediminicola]|uniref:peroxide stress protein YaaA n=1 Tax=Alteraquisediminimonas sediminicola TaxID=2676787 RepID=UPI001C8E1757|nr:peroxide stress protein YaaA [Aquisediminimonas sediminicola]